LNETTWAEMPAPCGDPPRHGSRAMRLLVPFVIAAVLFILGLRVAGVIVATAAVILLWLTFRAPAAAARVDHLFGRFGHWVGHVLGAVLLGIVDLLVFTPIAFVLWVCRYDPLAPGVARDAHSFWHAHTGRSLPTRPYADERSLFAPVGATTHRPARPVLRVATVVGVVSLLLLADLAAGWVYDEVSSATHGTPAVADTFEPASQPAFSAAPWAPELLAEQATLPGVRDTYLGYRLDALARRYTNVVDGARVSYEPATAGNKPTVWFFGGSALFGDGQRDEHTIPSEFARIAEAQGIPVEARNYGRPGIAMWQELELYEQLVGSGEKPDLVVFYDGFNDLAWQLNVLLTNIPVNVYDASASDAAAGAARQQISADISATRKRSRWATTRTAPSGFDAVVDAYWDQAGSRRVYDAVDELMNGSGAPRTQFAKGVEQHATSSAPANPQNIQAARDAVSIQKRASRLAAAIAAGQGADAAFFWQPNAFTKDLLPGEQAYAHMDLYDADRWVPAVTEARKLLRGSRYVDLGGALDSATTPVLWDFVHTNEEGARLVAAAMFDNLRPKLEQRRHGGAS
jgi:lysophospholipase L1-like esterase